MPVRGAGWARLLVLAVLGAGGASLAGFVDGGWWLLELCRPFQMQYLGVLGLCLIGLVGLRRWAWAALAGVLLLAPGSRMVPYYRGGNEPAGGMIPFRVLSFNVLSRNQRRAEVVDWVRETDPDLAFFPEVTPEWAAALEKLRATMPYQVLEPREGNFGFALFSKHPFLAEREVPSGLLDVATVRVELDIGGRKVVLIGAHPLPPLSGAMARDRDQVLLELADEVRQEPGPVVLAGDLNATPWCHAMKPVYAAGLRDSRWGRGVRATWRWRNPFFAIPIDHVLIKGAVAVENCQTGPDLGSDHRPVVVDLRL
ncbi:MAG: endonuclease/exonuclease/phosphatase family protein [Akkermansiaceae bacterium]|nr:endonuclease/exonuclease/phosphatase family protein [Akkermansiaceae bacterium]MCF7733380.1 endonuclease/exonuclease/phosphatase family protein [Akkermansiaceae bacterium]